MCLAYSIRRKTANGDQMKTVIFDLDGTLADTSADLIAAANACFRGLGLGDVLDPMRDQGTALRGGKAMLRLGVERLELPEEVIEAEYPKLLAHYGAEICNETVMYPGAVAAVEALRAEGVKVGICTNKPEALAEDLMRKLGVRGLFGSLVGADTLPVRKPDPAPYLASVAWAGGMAAQSLLVGDTVTDRKTAAAAGVPCILVTFGPEGAAAVEDLAPEAFLHAYEDLPGLVVDLLGPSSLG